MRPVYLTSSMMLRSATSNGSTAKVLTSYADIASVAGKMGTMSFISADDKDLPSEYKQLLEDCKKADALVISQRTNKLTGEIQNDANLQRAGFRDLPVRLWNNKQVIGSATVTGDDLKKVVFGIAKQDGDIVFDTRVSEHGLTKTPRIFANILAIQKA